MMNYKEIQNTEAAIDAFQDYFAREVAHPLFPSDPEASDTVETLLNEALINAWEHGNRKDPAKRVFVAWRILEGNGLQVSVRDEGPGFSTPNINHSQAPPVAQKRGRGLIIMSEFADSVSFNPAGNEITIVFKGQAN
jgi:anti-sigma regulatory factor (Ser/Thr protein kinase)